MTQIVGGGGGGGGGGEGQVYAARSLWIGLLQKKYAQTNQKKERKNKQTKTPEDRHPSFDLIQVCVRYALFMGWSWHVLEQMYTYSKFEACRDSNYHHTIWQNKLV